MAIKKENVLKELNELYPKVYKQDPLSQEILDRMMVDINKLNSGNDIQKYLVLNSDEIYDVLGNRANQMANTSKIMRGEIPNPTPNLNKVLGKDWSSDDKFYNTPVAKVKAIADEQGMELPELLEQMRAEKTYKDRYDILHGKDDMSGLKEDLQAIYMDLFTPSQQRAYVEGRNPTDGEIASDVIRDATYAIPASYIMKGFGPVKAGLMAAGIAPTVENVADMALADKEPKDAAIGAITGSITNMVAPYAVGMTGRMAERYLKGAGKAINEFIDPTIKTGKQVKQPYIDKAKLGKQYNEGGVGDIPIEDIPIAKSYGTSYKGRESLQDKIGGHDGGNSLLLKNVMTGKGDKDLGVIYQPGKTYNDKIANWEKAHKNIKLNDDDREYIRMAFELWEPQSQIMDSYGIRTAGDAISRDIMAQNISNRIGEELYNRGKILNRVPVIGQYIQEKQRESQEEADYKKRMDAAIADLIARGMYYKEK